MSGGIFLISEDGSLVRMDETAYESEVVLQSLLAEYPELLAGDQIDPVSPRQWLLVKREMGIAMGEDSSDRLSLDHLFLDQDGIPTLVEVKRATDTRIRREVVAQMLDYAANAAAYWQLGKIRTEYESRCERENLDPDAELEAFLSNDRDVESYWQDVKTNLQAGKIRMLFVADEIPQELRRIVEFLNQQMDPAEVLAVEVKQYEGQGQKSLVPRVIGQTAESQRRKGRDSRPSRKWDEKSFFTDLKSKCSPEAVNVARKLHKWAENCAELSWGQGRGNGSFGPILTQNGVQHKLFVVWSHGFLELYFYWYARKKPFDDQSILIHLLTKFNSIDGIKISRHSLNKRPTIPLETFAEDDQFEQLIQVFEWMLEQIKET